jgi:uncharacterized membrane protein YjjP (DUF1212 family)
MGDSGHLLEEINQNELPFGSWFAMAWALLWRGILIMIATAICGGIIGAILGFIVGLTCVFIGVPVEPIKIPLQILSSIIGLGIGLLFVIVQLRWFFRAKFKDFRIAIVKKNA